MWRYGFVVWNNVNFSSGASVAAGVAVAMRKKQVQESREQGAATLQHRRCAKTLAMIDKTPNSDHPISGYARYGSTPPMFATK
jgi:hypothetical protein